VIDDQPKLFEMDRPARPDRMSYKDMRGMESLSRHTDPLPSYVAADKVRQSGLAGKQRLQVYHGLRAHQGATSAELAQALGCDRYTPSRRLPELERAGWVCRGRRRRCSVSGIISETWFIARPWAEGRMSGAKVPSRTAQQAAPATDAGLPGHVLSPAERSQVRQRLIASGGPAGRFLQGLDNGGQKG